MFVDKTNLPFMAMDRKKMPINVFILNQTVDTLT